MNVNLNNAQILERGYVDQRSLLDVHAMRPFILRNGQVVCSYPTGQYQVAKNANGDVIRNSRGEEVRVPVYKNRIVVKNAILRSRDWEQIDAGVRDVMRQPLVGLDDLRANGLTQSLDGLGVSVSTYDQIGDMSPAAVHMSITPWKSEKDRPVFAAVSVPVPVITKPFMLDLRTLDASRRNGHEGLDVTGIRVATQKVRESIEEMIFNGSDVKIGTMSIYGFANHPYRIADTAGNFGGGDWGTDTNPHKTISGMIAALVARGFNGPFGAYVSATQYAQSLNLTGDAKTETQLSVIQRTIPDLRFIKRAPKLNSTTGEIIVYQLTKEVVDIAIGQDITTVSWQEFGGLVNEFMVIAAMVPRFKSDIDNNLGVAHATGI